MKMKKIKILLLTALFSFGLHSQTETLIASDYIETYDWFGAWYFNNPTTGYFTDISVTPTASAAIYGTGNNSIEADWYSLPAVTVDPFKDHIFRMRLAAQTISSPTASTAGLDGGDYIIVQLSKDGGSFVSELRVTGFSNATWDYSSTAVASKVSDGSITTFQPSGGGDRTSLGDGYSYIELTIPPGTSSIAIDVYCRANRAGEDWWMDNFELYEVSGVVLPVTLLYFEGSEINGVNSLEWSTASELNCDFYKVYRSTDNENWQLVTTTQGSGTTVYMNEYEVVDRKFSNSINYYKLHQVDYNGETTVYGPIAINNITSTEILKTINMMGQEVSENYKGVVIHIYSDGHIEKKLK